MKFFFAESLDEKAKCIEAKSLSGAKRMATRRQVDKWNPLYVGREIDKDGRIIGLYSQKAYGFCSGWKDWDN